MANDKKQKGSYTIREELLMLKTNFEAHLTTCVLNTNENKAAHQSIIENLMNLREELFKHQKWELRLFLGGQGAVILVLLVALLNQWI